MGSKHFSEAMRKKMVEMKSAGHAHRLIAEQSGLRKAQVDKFFERQNTNVKLPCCGLFFALLEGCEALGEICSHLCK